MRVVKDIKEFQKEFEHYVNKFDQVRELAWKFKTTPALIIDVLFQIGVRSLANIEEIAKEEIKIKLDKLFPEINDKIKNDFIEYFRKGLSDRIKKK